MSLFGVAIKPLGREVKSEHFNNAQLQELYGLFCIGSWLNKPELIANLAEEALTFPSFEAMKRDKKWGGMYRDGLGPFMVRALEMKAQGVPAKK